MEREKDAPEDKQEGTGTPPVSPADKKPWEEPKLTFVEPELTKHGKLDKITHGFFGTFSP
jgi:hypothetical protein